jgi:hypothetical protein
MSSTNDTSADVQRLLVEIDRKMPVAAKWRQLGQMYRTARTLHAMGVRARNPGAGVEEINEAWLTTTLGASTWRAIKESRDGPAG